MFLNLLKAIAMKNTFYFLLENIENYRMSEEAAVEQICDEYKQANKNDYAGLCGILKANLTISLMEYAILKKQNERLAAKLGRATWQLHEDLIQFQHEAHRNSKESTITAMRSCQDVLIELKQK